MEGRNLWLGVSLGDWLALGKDMAWQAQHNNPISNSFIVHDLKVVSETAKALGYEEDAARYQAQYQATRDAYLQMFVKEDGDVADDYQSAYIDGVEVCHSGRGTASEGYEEVCGKCPTGRIDDRIFCYGASASYVGGGWRGEACL